MNQNRVTCPTTICESLLLDEKAYNEEHAVLLSEVVIIDRLLERSIEMKDVYRELFEKLSGHRASLKIFLGVVLNKAAFWNPDRMAEARDLRKELDSVNRQIASMAADLATLLNERSELQEVSGFSSDTHYHVCDVVEASARANPLFKFYVQEHLDAIRGQFDLKYWPTLSDFLDEIAFDASDARSTATNPMTAVATRSARASRADFFRVLFASIDEVRDLLPHGFKLTDSSLASIGNCALDLAPEDMVDSTYVKNLRQRDRG